MKAEIVPAILVKNKQEFIERVRLVQTQSKTVHLDVMDGKFVNNETFSDPAAFARFKTKLKLGVHLMVENPRFHVVEWAKAGASRYIFHWESISGNEEARDLIDQINENGMEAGMAINPGTSVSKVKKILPSLDLILVMGVTPGWGGQKFDSKSLKKVKEIKKIAPGLSVGVDGGVKLENARDILKAGANFLVVGTAIYEAKDPVAELKKFKTLLVAGSRR